MRGRKARPHLVSYRFPICLFIRVLLYLKRKGETMLPIQL